jgi:2-polyprenyl-6-methoxyphenol hydroxylase-like FAD-dependent oxidoreductase
MDVIIAGAGLSGLALAHGLGQAGLDVRVLERRPSPADQPASYGIHLNREGLRALRACLPAANWGQLIASSVPAPDVVRFRDQQLRTLAVIDHEDPAADPALHRRAVSRGTLRDALLLGLNTTTHQATDVVQWGHAVTGYGHDPGGGLLVRGQDGTELPADLLVGADGSSSRVRAQRLPGLDRQELGILNIAGRVPLTAELSARLPATLTDGSVNNIVPAGPGWMFAATWRIDPGATPATAGPAATFLVWAWAAGRPSYPADIDTRTPASCATWSPNGSRGGRPRSATSSPSPTRPPSPRSRCEPCRSWPAGPPPPSPCSATPSTT